MNRRHLVPVLVIAAMAGSVARASAHHSANAEFDLTAKQISKTGVLTKVEIVNPHGRLYFDVTEPDGKTAQWSVSLTAPSGLLRFGVKPKSDFKIGATYTFTAFPARDGSNLGLLTALQLPDGRTISFRGVEREGNATAGAN